MYDIHDIEQGKTYACKFKIEIMLDTLGIGYSVGIKNGLEKATNAVIDNLIENGYLKTRGHKNNPEILKHDSAD